MAVTPWFCLIADVVAGIMAVVVHFSKVLETEKAKNEEETGFHWDVDVVREILATAVHR